MNLTKIAKYYSDPEAARTFLEKQVASSGFRVCGRQPFRYAPERPTTGKVRVARDSGVTLCTVICPTMYGPPHDCKRKVDGREKQSASMYPAFGWRVFSWPR
jgi:hypothetical protein